MILVEALCHISCSCIKSVNPFNLGITAGPHEVVFSNEIGCTCQKVHFGMSTTVQDIHVANVH